MFKIDVKSFKFALVQSKDDSQGTPDPVFAWVNSAGLYFLSYPFRLFSFAEPVTAFV